MNILNLTDIHAALENLADPSLLFEANDSQKLVAIAFEVLAVAGSRLGKRLAHLAVIDVLAVGVSKIRGPDVERHLRKLNRGLQSLRTGDE